MTQALAAVELPRRHDPETLFAALFAAEPHVFWLDAGPGARAGWSWMGAGTPVADPHRVGALPLAPSAEARTAAAAVPGPFAGGWVGWSSYDAAAAAAGATRAPHDGHAPEELWLRTDTFLAFDHDADRLWVIGPPAEADALAARVGAVPAEGDAPVAPAPDPALTAPGHARARHRPGEYAELIARCRDAIREGDAYQLCLTTRFEVAGDVDPVAVHLRLRHATPAHHGGFIRSGSHALVSASPERFLEVRDGAEPGARVVRTHPIKGTRPRGRDAAEDRALAAELVASAKERAENIMIVDLMRNDLSRVCVDGTVAVDRLLEVESYPAVHQLVSTVSGTLAPGTTVGGLLAAAFPAGSMTGAPKLSAMTILHGLERGPRGVFAGCFGWVSTTGALDLAMVIRSVVVHPGGAYVGAGGGITWHSDAAAEVAEVAVKARGPLAALGATLPPGW